MKHRFARVGRVVGAFLSVMAVTLIAEPEVAVTLDEVLKDAHGERLEEFKQVVSQDRVLFEKEMFVYDCKYVQASTLRRVLEEFISSDGMVSESLESDQLVLSERSDQIGVLRSIIERLDQPVPQILVEARIMELNIDSDLEKEVDLYYQDIGTNPITGLPRLEKVGSQLGVPGAAPSSDGGIFDSSIWENGSESLNLFVRYLENKW